MTLGRFKSIFLILLSAICIWLSYPPFSFTFLLPFGIFGFLWVVQKDFSLKNKFLLGSAGGLLYFFLFMKWFWSLYPLSWAGVDNKFLGAVVVLLIWIISALSGGVFWGVWVWLSSLLKIPKLQDLKINNVFYSSGAIASLFVLSEYARSWFFTLVWAGSGSFWGANWTWGNLAYDFSNNFIVNYLTIIGGIYFIEFLVVFLTALCFFLLRGKNKFKQFGLVGVFILAAVFYLPNFTEFKTKALPTAEENLNVVVVQTRMPSDINLSSQTKIDEFKLQLSMLHEASKLNSTPQLIIFPEGANFISNLFSILDESQLSNFFGGLFKERVLIVDNDLVFENGIRKSKVVFIDSKDGLVDSYDKQFLTPGGEFMPYWFEFLFKRLAKDKVSEFIAHRALEKGNLAPPVVDLQLKNEVKAGAVICSAIFSPGLFRGLSSKEPGFIIILASTGIFRGADDLVSQNIAIVQIRAIENRKPVILSANFGRSFILDYRGKVVKITESEEPQLFTGVVVPYSNKTLYNKLGDWPVILALMYGLFILRPRRTSTKKNAP